MIELAHVIDVFDWNFVYFVPLHGVIGLDQFGCFYFAGSSVVYEVVNVFIFEVEV